MSLIPTGSLTVGPFFNFGLTTNVALGKLAGDAVVGDRIRLLIQVLDGDRAPAAGDAMIEIWQADAAGKYKHPADEQAIEPDPDFQGFGRLETDASGCCAFETVKPGGVPGPGGAKQAPHVNVSIFARGLLKQLLTRVYFAGDPANADDPVLLLVPESRRGTLMAHPHSELAGHWHIEIHLQGESETVFFDV